MSPVQVQAAPIPGSSVFIATTSSSEAISYMVLCTPPAAVVVSAGASSVVLTIRSSARSSKKRKGVLLPSPDLAPVSTSAADVPAVSSSASLTRSSTGRQTLPSPRRLRLLLPLLSTLQMLSPVDDPPVHRRRSTDLAVQRQPQQTVNNWKVKYFLVDVTSFVGIEGYCVQVPVTTRVGCFCSFT